MTLDQINRAVREAIADSPLSGRGGMFIGGTVVHQGLDLVLHPTGPTRWSRADDSLVAEIRVVEGKQARYGRLLIPSDVGWKQLQRGLAEVIAATARMEPGSTAVVTAK